MILVTLCFYTRTILQERGSFLLQIEEQIRTIPASSEEQILNF